jgi:outer membrane receptor protein involved in Fe transport
LQMAAANSTRPCLTKRAAQAICFAAFIVPGQAAWSAPDLPADPASTQPAAASTATTATPGLAPAPGQNTPQTISITGKIKPVQTAIDRKIYNVANDLQSLTGNAADVLNTIPSVEVDADGNVSLRGDDRVTILVDGKPSAQLSGARAGDGLLQFSASDIEKIEVMTNAPAEYGADGTAGVINLVTKKNRKQGASGTIMLNAGNQRRTVDAANGAYNTEKLSLSGGIGLREDDRQRITTTNVAVLDQGGAATEFNRDRLDEHARRLIPSLNGALDYRADDAQSIGFDFKLRQRSGHRYYDTQNQSTLQDGTPASTSYGHSDGHEWSMGGEQRLRFKQNLSSPEETLDISLHRTTDIERERYALLTTSTFPAAGFGGNQLFLNHAFMSNDFSVDYRTPLGADKILKLGYSVKHDNNGYDNAGSTIDPVSGQLVQDPNLNNQFRYLQTIQAVYGSYQQPIGKWQLLAGLRAEHTSAEGDQLTSNLVTRQNYAGLYPSLHLEQALDEQSTLSFGYSRRLSRPDPDDLNPYIDHHDSQNLQGGNPNLLPQESQSLEAGYRIEAEKQTYGVTGYLRHFKNSFTDVTALVSQNVLLTTKANLPSSKASGVEFNTDGPLAPALSYRLSGNLFYSQVDATALGAQDLASTTGLNLKASIDYRPTAIDTAQLSMTRADKRLTAQGYVAAINLVNLGYKRQLQPNLSMVVTVSDVFNGQRQQRFINTSALTETYERDQAGRIAYFGLVYTFGTQKKTKAAGFEYDQP